MNSDETHKYLAWYFKIWYSVTLLIAYYIVVGRDMIISNNCFIFMHLALCIVFENYYVKWEMFNFALGSLIFWTETCLQDLFHF